jgi:hypothetical protein
MKITAIKDCLSCGHVFDVEAELCYDATNGEEWVEPATDADGQLACPACGEDCMDESGPSDAALCRFERRQLGFDS